MCDSFSYWLIETNSGAHISITSFRLVMSTTMNEVNKLINQWRMSISSINYNDVYRRLVNDLNDLPIDWKKLKRMEYKGWREPEWFTVGIISLTIFITICMLIILFRCLWSCLCCRCCCCRCCCRRSNNKSSSQQQAAAPQEGEQQQKSHGRQSSNKIASSSPKVADIRKEEEESAAPVVHETATATTTSNKGSGASKRKSRKSDSKPPVIVDDVSTTDEPSTGSSDSGLASPSSASNNGSNGAEEGLNIPDAPPPPSPSELKSPPSKVAAPRLLGNSLTFWHPFLHLSFLSFSFFLLCR
jgi:hypothetical protein